MIRISCCLHQNTQFATKTKRNARAPYRRSAFLLLGIAGLIGGFFVPRALGQTATATSLSVTAGGSAVDSVSSHTVVTLTATVTGGGSPVTSGQVNFCDAAARHCSDIHVLGSAQLTTSGGAVFKFVPGPGNHSYNAVFVGTKGPGRSPASGGEAVSV